MFVLKPSANAQELPNNIHKIYREIFESKREKLDKVLNVVNYPAEMSFDVKYYHESAKLFKNSTKSLEKSMKAEATKHFWQYNPLIPVEF